MAAPDLTKTVAIVRIGSMPEGHGERWPDGCNRPLGEDQPRELASQKPPFEVVMQKIKYAKKGEPA